ncbi:MAG: MMPL family transporter [Clostridiales bacterium]|nr:MMPL family transporter [Clostridiales bacterium]
MAEKIFKALTARPRLVLLTAFLALIPCAIGYFNTGVSYDLFSYLPPELESVKGEKLISENFGGSSSAFLAVEGKSAAETAALEKRIEAAEGVRAVIWADDIFDVTFPAEMLPSPVRDIFYSDDGNDTLMLILFSGNNAGGTRAAVGEVRSLLPDGCYLSGTSAILSDTKALTDRQLPFYILSAAAVSFVIMLFTTGSWTVPPLMLITLGLGIAYNMGTNIIFGQISYITQSISAVLQLAVTMDYSIFLIDRYMEERDVCSDSRAAVIKAARATIQSISGSVLTTVSGFAALCFMKLSLGRDIGFVMIKGTFLGAAAAVTVLPPLLLVFDRHTEKLKHKSLIPDFSRPAGFVLRHRNIFAALLVTLLIPGALLHNKAEKYYTLITALPESMESVAALKKVRDKFGIVTTHFVVVNDGLPADSMLSLIEELESENGVTNVIAYNKYVGPAIPEALIPDKIRDICKKNGRQIMLVNSLLESGTAEMQDQLAALRGTLAKHDKDAILSGEGALYEDLINVADSDFRLTGLLSAAFVFLIIALMFKSAAVPAALIAAIELSIFLNESIPFFLSSEISFISPTFVSCIQLGATVDYAILLLLRAREERRAGLCAADAVKAAAVSSAKSIMGSALVFFGTTFSVYLISDFEIIKNICAMLACGSLISCAVILLLLTPFLAVFGRLVGKEVNT